MAQTIPAVNSKAIEHGVLIELTVPNSTNTNTETFYFSNCYQDITYQGNTYSRLGAFLQIGEIQNNLQNAVDELSITLSGIPAGYLELIVDRQIKGGEVRVLRVFYNPATQLVQQVDGVDQIFLRFKGIVNNYAVQEDFSQDAKEPIATHNITLTCSSILSVLENRVSGRRTNRTNYQVKYTDRQITLTPSSGTWGNFVLNDQVTTDKSMNRIEALHNANFDFGKEGSAQDTGSSGGGGTSDTTLHPSAPDYNPMEQP
jgi:hypothetical protein